MKGIILSGGTGTRLFPVTECVSKQLLLVYDKPMIYYPLSTLMLAGIRDILVITTPRDESLFERLLGNGEQFGIQIRYAVQPHPRGIAEAFLIRRDFIGDDSVALALGDNILFGHGLPDVLRKATDQTSGGTILAYHVADPSRYGVVEMDAEGMPIDIVEKPREPRSSYAVTGLYFFDNQVIHIAEQLRPSARGELEITDVNLAYLRRGQLRMLKLGRGVAWLDTGTYDSLLQAGIFIQTVQERQGLMVACLEEIAFGLGYIGRDEIRRAARKMDGNSYGRYLMRILEEELTPLVSRFEASKK